MAGAPEAALEYGLAADAAVLLHTRNRGFRRTGACAARVFRLDDRVGEGAVEEARGDVLRGVSAGDRQPGAARVEIRPRGCLRAPPERVRVPHPHANHP